MSPEKYSKEIKQDEVTLRDLFAAHAMNGLRCHYGTVVNSQRIASLAYEQAEAMLKERERIRNENE